MAEINFRHMSQENPCVSFVTPSMLVITVNNMFLLTNHLSALITGDRSLTDVVIHELTHFWFGNGVTWVPLFALVISSD